MDDDTNELAERLSTAAGIIMEDYGPIAITALPPTAVEIEARLRDLEEATRDATLLFQAAQVLTRRNIR